MSDASENIRAFICIRLESALIEELSDLERRLESALPKNVVRWNSPEQIHLTLKFLGSIPSTAIQNVRAALQSACSEIAPFQLRAEGVGAFPGLRSPRVIWVGLVGDLEILLTLQSQIDSATQRWSEDAEPRAFQPHLTLARVKAPQQWAIRKIGESIQTAKFMSQHPWRVEQTFLMQSQLSPRGAVHTVIASAPLSGPTELQKPACE